jgi:hypothetical protein
LRKCLMHFALAKCTSLLLDAPVCRRLRLLHRLGRLTFSSTPSLLALRAKI